MQPVSRPRAAVIIASGNRRALPECVTSLSRCATERPDLASQIEVSIAADPDIPETKPAGFLRASFTTSGTGHPGHKRNLAVSKTTARFLFFIDDDTFPDAAWLETALRICREDRQVVAGRSKMPEAKGSLDRILEAMLSSRIVTGGSGYIVPLGDRIRFYDVFLCNACIRRDVFEAVGGFVEKAPYTMDDTEFFYLCELLGIPLSPDNRFVIRHGFTGLWRPHLRKNIARTKLTGLCRQLFPEIYEQLPAITAADWSPVLAAGAVLAAPLVAPVYAAVMASEALRSGLDLRETACFVAAAAMHHATALYAYNAGRVRAFTHRAGYEEGLAEITRRRALVRSKARVRK